MTAAAQPTPPRLHCLDGLRGLLAAYVLLHHGMPFLATAAVGTWLPAVFGEGTAAVDGFLVLSGMVVSRALASHPQPFAAFMARRAARLLPCYLIALCLGMLALSLPPPFAEMPWMADFSRAKLHWPQQWPEYPLLHVLLHLPLAHGLVPQAVLPYAHLTLLGPAWSLSLEWQFYLLLPLLLPALGWRPWRLVAVLLAMAWAMVPANLLLLGPDAGFSIAFLPMKAHFFALGIATAAWWQGGPGASSRLLYCLLAVLLLALLAGGWHKLVAPLFWMAVVLAQRGWPMLRPLRRLLLAPPLQGLGTISYPLYLVHQPVQRLLATVMAPPLADQPLAFTLLWGGGGLLLSLLLAVLLHHGVEKPGMAWAPSRRRLPAMPLASS